jgi:hypothetical protein
MKYIRSILGKKAITSTTAVLVICLLLAVGALGYMAYHGVGGPCGAGTMWNGVNCVAIPGTSQTQTAAQSTPAPSGVNSYLLEFIGVQDAFSGTDLHSATHTDIVIFNPADHTRALETISAAANAQISAGFYIAGQKLLVYVWSDVDPANEAGRGATHGDEYYPEWFTVTIGGAVNILRPPDSPGTGTNPEAQIQELPYGQCTLGGTATAGYYWVVSPALKLYPRALNTVVTMNVQNPDGTLSLAAAADAATGHTFATQGSQSRTYTATGKQFTVKLVLNIANLALVWGRPTILLSSIAPYNFQCKYPVLWVAFNSTALQRDYTQGTGFAPITTQPVGWWVVWQTIPTQGGIGAAYSDLSNTGSVTISIRIDTSAITAATQLAMATYLGDLQTPGDAAVGSANGAPTAYGGIGNTGVDGVVGVTYAIATTGINGGSNVPKTGNEAEDFFVTG